MKHRILALALTAMLALPAFGAQLRAQPQPKSDLRILYVGGTADFETMGVDDIDPAELEAGIERRMRSFESFLNDYFSSVTVVNARDYTQIMSDDFDVTVLDGLPRPISPRYSNREKGIYLQDGYFTEDFDRPVLTVAHIGDRTGRRIGVKNDWYCLCLDAHAHNWREHHPIFHGPFGVDMTVEQRPTPEDAYHYEYYHDGPIPDSLPMWRVQTTGYVTESGFRIGMVARPWGYEDSPDAEYISSGVCQKTLDAVAIGRHANFLHWGFAASPEFMTEEAKPVLANAIVYISQFAGTRPIARKYNDRIATREYLKELRYLLTREYYEHRLKSDAEWEQKMIAEQQAAAEKQSRGEKLSGDEKRMLNYKPSPQQQRTFEQHLERYGKEFYGMFGTDIPAYGKYFDENYGYFYGGEGSYVLVVDEDAKSLGIHNNDIALIDTAIGMLESGTQTDKAARILSRYTLMDFAAPAQWRAWFETNKERMFWTEAGGWLFLVDSPDPAMNDYHAREVKSALINSAPGATDDKNPVSVTADVVALQEGGFMIYIRTKIHPGYHIYDEVASSDAFIPTAFKIGLPEGYSAVGDPVRPSGTYYNQKGTTVYEDEVVFLQKIDGTGGGKLECTVSFQCCDAHVCFPPESKTVTLEI